MTDDEANETARDVDRAAHASFFIYKKTNAREGLYLIEIVSNSRVPRIEEDHIDMAGYCQERLANINPRTYPWVRTSLSVARPDETSRT